MDANEFRSAAKQLVDYIADYLENIRERDVLPSVKPGYIKELIPETAPEDGEEWSAIFKDIERVIMPGVSDFINVSLFWSIKLTNFVMIELN